MRRIGKIFVVVVLSTLASAAVGCDSKGESSRGSAKSRKPTSLPSAPPDLRTVSRILTDGDKPSASGESPSATGIIARAGGELPPGHPPIAGAAAPPPATGALPEGHPPITPQSAIAPPPTDVSPLKYSVPAEWKVQDVDRPFRKAQFVLPRTAGDPEDGQLIVYYFGRNEGGGVEGNIMRWRGMFSTADGRPVPDESVRRESKEVAGMKVTTLDVSGRYADAMGRPQSPGPTASEFRMLAVIVETPDGPWFFKAVGPAATMATHAGRFESFVASIHR